MIFLSGMIFQNVDLDLDLRQLKVTQQYSFVWPFCSSAIECKRLNFIPHQLNIFFHGLKLNLQPNQPIKVNFCTKVHQQMAGLIKQNFFFFAFWKGSLIPRPDAVGHSRLATKKIYVSSFQVKHAGPETTLFARGSIAAYTRFWTTTITCCRGEA